MTSHSAASPARSAQPLCVLLAGLVLFDNAHARCRLMSFLTSSLAGAATIDACP